MTAPIEVDTARLRSAAAIVRGAGVEFRATFKKAGPELAAGGDQNWAAVRALHTAAQEWRDSLADLYRRTLQHAEAISTAAANYDGTDQRSAARGRLRAE